MNSSCRHSLHCILPPYLLDRLLRSGDEDVRDETLRNIILSAEFRTARRIQPLDRSRTIFATTPGKKYREIYDMENLPPNPLFFPGKLVRSEGEKATPDQAVNEAYNHSGTTYDFFHSVFQRHSLDDKGQPLISSVHVGRKFSNAFWDGRLMAYGDGDGKVFHRFTKSVEVVGHELTHGVISHECDLEYQGESGALNEHFADVFGILIRQWKKKTSAAKSSWLIGDGLLVPASTRKAIRNMKQPGTAYRDDPMLGDDPQPDHMKKKYMGLDDNGGVHLNSGIPNRAFYLVAIGLGGNAWEKAGSIWYQALRGLSSKSQFADMAKLSVDLASKLGRMEKVVVANAWKSVGL